MSKNRKPYKLGDALLDLFDTARNPGAVDHEAMLGYALEISANTGVEPAALAEFIKEAVSRGETIAQLRYRIIGDMQKRKMETSFII